MRIVLGHLLVALVVAGLFSCSGRSDLEILVEEANKDYPARIDSETRIDNIEVHGENTLRYNYTLLNVLAQNVDTFQFRRALWPGILSMIKLSPDMKKLREAGTTIEYHYNDQQNKPICTFTITPAHYK